MKLEPFDGRRECAVIGAENGVESTAPSLSNERPSEIYSSGVFRAEMPLVEDSGEGQHATTTRSDRGTVSIQSDPLEIYSGDLIESLFKTVERIQG